jgi:hypothetical protein
MLLVAVMIQANHTMSSATLQDQFNKLNTAFRNMELTPGNASQQRLYHPLAYER